MGRAVNEVLRRMRAIDAALPSADGVAVFNRVYLQVTELVRNELRAGAFADGDFMERLDVIFAGMYLRAVEETSAASVAPRSWRPLLEARARRGLVPVQFVLAAMNAHIDTTSRWRW